MSPENKKQNYKRYMSWFLLSFGRYPHPKDRIKMINIEGFRGYAENVFYDKVINLFPEILGEELLSKGRLIHEDRHKKSILYSSPSLPLLPLFVKYYDRHHFGQDFKDIIRGSQARKSFLMAFELERYSMLTPMPLAFLERWHMGVRKESFLICKGYPEGLPAAALFRNLYLEGDRDKFLQAIQAFSAVVLDIEKIGLRHGCLMSSLLAIPNRDGPPLFYLTDLEQVCTIGAINEHDCFRMAGDVHLQMNHEKKECLNAICEEGKRVGSSILQNVIHFM